ncbi:hypothetical protein [uncultured Cyclobacterium sp.]|uniref:hypothetical protein n=1 Tax=uncultured Cyclobacterium sp. TaxID=453820 RepID=UPI0030EF26AB|tara:strand:- start:472 stop:681 length:210 start_codon:yes stop_codon:yes gene_type:complete
MDKFTSIVRLLLIYRDVVDVGKFINLSSSKNRLADLKRLKLETVLRNGKEIGMYSKGLKSRGELAKAKH